MSCPCDQKDFPQKLEIHAGLANLPRALGMFPEWRLAILDAIGRQPRLHHWRARGEEDFGVMLVEMGAYLFDVLSFYDALLSNDSYLHTSQLDGTARKLTSLLGYIPRPALASQAWLAAEAGGRRLVELPANTAFRSGEYDGNPPEVFEVDQAAWLDPRLNKHRVSRVIADDIPPGTLSEALVTPNSLRTQKGAPVVLSFNGTLRAAYVGDIQTVPLRSRRPATEISFQSPVAVPLNAKYSQLRIFAMGNSTALWRESNPFSGANVLLDGRAPIRAGEFVLFEKQGQLLVRRVAAASVSKQTILSGVTTTVKDLNGDVTAELESPDVKTSVSQLQLNNPLLWSGVDSNKITAYYSVSDAARVLIPERDELHQGDPIVVPTYIDDARVPIENLLLEDTHFEGVHSTGVLDAGTRSASIDSDPVWGKTLVSPVDLYGNIFKASRGESVVDELLGTGDATVQWQNFDLKKSPLTYLPADNAEGLVSTLEVHVGGVRWMEVSTFFGVQVDEQVYLVQHNEEGTTTIEFGGGARLPSGAPVYANYRFGAGAAVPPAGSIIQLARPLDGLNSIRNMLPAFGGGDAESADDMRHYAPDSALLLGRTISLVDLEAAAHRVSGVEAVKAVFRWDRQRFEKRAVIYFIGDPQLKSGILASLQAMSEPDAAIDVIAALPETATISLDLEIDDRYHANDVIEDVQDVLYRAPESSLAGGLLHRTSLGPEGPVLHSHVMNAIVDVPGISCIQNMTVNEAPVSGYGVVPGAEHYFDFGEIGTTTSGITINGVH